jgi:chromate reductase, NAD(P)H dehydrogenase (quinone)
LYTVAMIEPRLVAFGGALRRESYNQKLVALAAAAARDAGAQVELVLLRDFPMPILDEDLEREQGLPEGAKRFRELLLRADGVLISAPEYNSSISGALKNAIDWASRQQPGEKPLACFKDKTCGLLAASPCPFGGLRGLITTRRVLSHLGMFVVPEQVLLPKASAAFAADGKLVDAAMSARVSAFAAKFVDVTRRLRA